MEIIVNTYGAQLNKNNGLIEVDYPETGETRKFPVSKITSISLTNGVRISVDVMILALENDIDILFTNNHGHCYGRIWNNRFGSISSIRQQQLGFKFLPAGVAWIRDCLESKTNNQVQFIQRINKPSGKHYQKNLQYVSWIKDQHEKIKLITGEQLLDCDAVFRAAEANSSRFYFQALSSLMPEDFVFEKRSKHPPLDPFNSALNYCYSLIYGRCEAALIKAGLDPFIGVLHVNQHNRPCLVYDFIEKFRIWADRCIYDLFLTGRFEKSMFYFEEGKGCLLNQDARKILIFHFNEYLNEVIEYKSNRRSRLSHIQLEAQYLATLVKGTAKDDLRINV